MIPDLNGKLTCTVDPVPPTPDVSVVTLTVQLEEKVNSLVCFSIQLINGNFLFRRHMKKFVLQLKKLPMVH